MRWLIENMQIRTHVNRRGEFHREWWWEGESWRGGEVSPKIARHFDGPHNESEVGNQQRWKDLGATHALWGICRNVAWRMVRFRFQELLHVAGKAEAAAVAVAAAARDGANLQHQLKGSSTRSPKALRPWRQISSRRRWDSGRERAKGREGKGRERARESGRSSERERKFKMHVCRLPAIPTRGVQAATPTWSGLSLAWLGAGICCRCRCRCLTSFYLSLKSCLLKSKNN